MTRSLLNRGSGCLIFSIIITISFISSGFPAALFTTAQLFSSSDSIIESGTDTVNVGLLKDEEPNTFNDAVPDNVYLLNKGLLKDGRFSAEIDLSHFEKDLFIIQFSGPIVEPWLEYLKHNNLEILSYIPDYAFIVRGDVRSLNGFDPVYENIVWIGEYRPLYKISPELLEIYLEQRFLSERSDVNKPGTDQNEIEQDTRTNEESEIIEVNVASYFRNDYFLDVIEELYAFDTDIVLADEFDKIIRARMPMDRLVQVSRLSEVEWIERYYEPKPLMDNIRNYTGGEFLHLKGFNGTGIVGEAKDNGFDRNHKDFDGQIAGIDGNPNVEAHGTSVFGIIFSSGNNSNKAMGMMPGGKGVMCSWGVGRTASIRNLVNNWGGLFQSNSWYSGNLDSTYSSLSQTNDQAVMDYQVTMLYAAGNSNQGVSKKSISQDAASKNIITVGAVRHYNTKSRTDDKWSSGGSGSTPSQGPAADERIKPDLCGPFDSIYTTDVSGSSGYTTTDYYSSFGGTSGATPVVAGNVGLVYQMYRANHFDNDALNELPAPSTVKALLIADAYQYSLSSAFRYQQGWGTPDLKNMYEIGPNHLIVNETTSLTTGTNTTYTVFPQGTKPLKITLVWTDYRGTTSASKHLVNDLDLEITDPDGNKYYGNKDLNTSLWSSSSATPKFDRLNNVENVFIQSPKFGKWTIKVLANNVPQDGDSRTPATDQAFALVASGIRQGTVLHDVAITSVKAPLYVVPDKQTTVNASIFNFGIDDEKDLNINLTVNGSLVNVTTIGSLTNFTGTEFDVGWTPSTGIHDVEVEVSPVAGEQYIINNNHSVQVIAEPDVRVSSLDLPAYGVLNKNNVVNASIDNIGAVLLNNVNITLSVNGSVVNWTFIDMAGFSSKNVIFNWTPLTNGIKSIMVEAEPNASESLVEDNNKSGSVFITPYEPIDVFVLDSWGNDYPTAWDILNDNWQDYGKIPVIINYTAFNDVPVSYQNLTKVDADVLLISAAYASIFGYEFSDAEIADIQKYTEEGHGLVITSYTFYRLAPNNYKFGPIVGLNEKSSTSFNAVSSALGIEVFFGNHSLFDNISASFTPGSGSSVTPADNSWDDLNLNEGAIIAGNSTTGRSAIIDNHGVYYISNWLELSAGTVDHQLFYNAFITSNYTSYTVDVALHNFTGLSGDIPFGENVSYNVSVQNIGTQPLTNLNVTFFTNGNLTDFSIITNLPAGAYTNLSFNWIADRLGDYSIIVNVTEQPGESYIFDNIRKAEGSVLPNPEIDLIPSAFDLIGNETEFESRTLLIENSGLNDLDFNIYATGYSWISFNVTSGTVKVGQSQAVNVTFSAVSLTKKHYYGNITVVSNDLDEPFVLIPVHFLVYGQLKYIKIQPDNFTINTDYALQFTATGYNKNHNSISFAAEWSTNDPSGWITSSGVYYPGVQGNWTITCGEQGGVVVNSTMVNVDPSPLDHIDISPTSWSGTADDSQTFSATGRDSSNGFVNFSPVWSTDDPFGTISSGGLYQPGKAGDWQITCKNFKDTITASVTVSISPGALQWLEISPNGWAGRSGDTFQFISTGFDIHDNIVDFTRSWSTDDPKGTISNLGIYTAGTVGKWNVTCENAAQTYSDTVTVTVAQGDLNSIQITPGVVNITTDDSVSFKAVGLDLMDNKLEIKPSWSVNGGGTIDNDTGLFEAESVGSWIVYANYSGFSETAFIEISYGNLKAILISPEKSMIYSEAAQKFTAQGFDGDGNQRPVSPTWAVSGGGIINPVTGIFQARWAGKWKVYANQTGVSGTTDVTVLPGNLSFIMVTPSGREVSAGDSIQFHAEGRDSIGNPLTIDPEWEVNGGGSINPKTGLYSAQTIGSWTVTATIGSISGTTSVHVTHGALERVVVDPSTIEITADEIIRFNASGFDPYKNDIDIQPIWSVNGGGVVNETGFFTPDSTGRWEIYATYENITGVASVIVTMGIIVKLTIEPEYITMKLGETRQFSAFVSDIKGNTIEAFPSWQVSQSAGVINSEGIFYAKRPGTWNITASYKGSLGNAQVVIILGTDTDSDGMSDEWELKYDLDPLIGSDANEDLDDDGISNLDEYLNGTLPNNEDSDGDQIDDYWEFYFGMDPLNASDSEEDADNDGFSNLEEYIAKTDPNDDTDHPPREFEAVTNEGIDKNLLLVIALIIVVIVVTIILAVWLFQKRKAEAETDHRKLHREQEIIDVDYDDEFDTDAVFVLDDEPEITPPPPPPPGRVTHKTPERKKVARKTKPETAKKVEEPKRKAKGIRPVKGKRPEPKKPVAKKKKPLKVKPDVTGLSRKREKIPPGKKAEIHECPRCSEPITVPFVKEDRVKLSCTFCGGKTSIPNPYLHKPKKTGAKKKKSSPKKPKKEKKDDVSWDDEPDVKDKGRDDDLNFGEFEFEEDDDGISWDDHKRYRPDGPGSKDDDGILWDDDDDKPYKPSSKKKDDEFLWD